MAVCAVCQAPCRGSCARCGARLCAQHKPASTRVRCAICKRLRTGVAQTAQAIPPYPTGTAIAKSTSTPYGSAGPLATLAQPDQLAWIADRRAKLQQKQQRERRYLSGRAARGTHTSTDEDYEADALLENDLLEALDLLETCLQGHVSLPASPSIGPSSTYAGDTSMLFPVPGPHDKLQP